MTLLSDQNLYTYSLLTLLTITPLTILSLLFTTAPYGKHNRPGWGPTIPPPLAWFLMESPTLFLTLLLFPHGKNFANPKAFLLMSPFFIHYAHRTLVYPLKLFLRVATAGSQRYNNKPVTGNTVTGFPVTIALTAFGFNMLNGYLQSRWVSHYADMEDDNGFWLRFGFGNVIFVSGMFVNVWADNVLIGLKEMGGGYRVPKGGLFEWVSVPNYFGEIVEWFGWAVMCWSWAGFGFFVYTCANLVPRGVATHKWYLDKFGEDYPKNRKAVIPFVY